MCKMFYLCKLCHIPIAFAAFLILTGAFVYFYRERMRKREIPFSVHNHMFPLYFALAAYSFLVTLHWFVGKSGVPVLRCEYIWHFVEKGSMAALSKVMTFLGIGSVITTWVFNKQDDTTFGKTQYEIIESFFGVGYAWSLVIHFVCTACSIVMLECHAKEPALCFCITVIAGCLMQSRIFVGITMNQRKREGIAAELWNRESERENAHGGDGTSTPVIARMAMQLGDPHIRCSSEYRDKVGSVLGQWLCQAGKEQNQEETFKRIAEMFQGLSVSIPEWEKEVFECQIIEGACQAIESTCRQIEEKSKNSDQKNDVKKLICQFACGYYLYLYKRDRWGKYSGMIIPGMVKVFQLSESSASSGQKQFCGMFLCVHYALRWYDFLEKENCEMLFEDYFTYDTSTLDESCYKDLAEEIIKSDEMMMAINTESRKLSWQLISK